MEISYKMTAPLLNLKYFPRKYSFSKKPLIHEVLRYCKIFYWEKFFILVAHRQWSFVLGIIIWNTILRVTSTEILSKKIKCHIFIEKFYAGWVIDPRHL